MQKRTKKSIIAQLRVEETDTYGGESNCNLSEPCLHIKRGYATCSPDCKSGKSGTSRVEWNAGYYWAIEGGDLAIPNDCYYRAAWVNGWRAGDKARKARYERG